MATTVITGRDISLSFTGGTDIEAQATSAVLTKTMFAKHIRHLMAKLTRQLTSKVHFALSMLADWGKANSVCEALWTAAETAPDNTITMTMTAATGAVFAFDVFQNFLQQVALELMLRQ
jgi:hypothetical protein